jgi:hypothetical protein
MELEALCDPAVRAAVRDARLQLRHFGEPHAPVRP